MQLWENVHDGYLLSAHIYCGSRLKLPFCSQLNKILNKIFKEMKESVSKEKNITTLVFLRSNYPQLLRFFYDWPAKYYF